MYLCESVQILAKNVLLRCRPDMRAVLGHDPLDGSSRCFPFRPPLLEPLGRNSQQLAETFEADRPVQEFEEVVLFGLEVECGVEHFDALFRLVSVVQ